MIGAASGLMVTGSSWFLVHMLRIDEPINAIPVHGFVGILGTLALALVTPAEVLPSKSHLVQFGVQLLGVAGALAWALTTASIPVFLCCVPLGYCGFRKGTRSSALTLPNTGRTPLG